MLEQLTHWIEERRRERALKREAQYRAKHEHLAIEWDNQEIRVREVGIEGRIRFRCGWKFIRRMIGLKMDRLVVDEVVIVVEGQNGSFAFVEDMVGFWEFQKDCQKYLEGAKGPEEFWNRVVMPPFETCLTTLYESK